MPVGSFGLPIAIGILAATGIISQEQLFQYLILGELSLGGNIKTVKGSLQMAIAAKASGYSAIFISFENRQSAAVVQDIAVLQSKTLSEIVDF